MATTKEIEELCEVALREENEWRYGGPEARHAAYERFEQLLRTVSALSDRPYEEVFNEAIEHWIKLHFCCLSNGTPCPPEERVTS